VRSWLVKATVERGTVVTTVLGAPVVIAVLLRSRATRTGLAVWG
jgi:hypothetical protein